MSTGAKGKIRRIAGFLYKTALLKGLYPLRYRQLARAHPVKPRKAVLLEVRMERLTDSFIRLKEELVRRGGWELKEVFLREGMAGKAAVLKSSLKALEDLCDAGIILVNDSSFLVGCLPLRPQTKVIQLWHGCGAFKKFGYSAAEGKFGASARELDFFPFYRNFAAVTVSSREVRWAYEQAFRLPIERIEATGVARTDIFYDKACIRRAGERLKGLLGERLYTKDGRRKRVVLYAPTFRGSVAGAVSPQALDFACLREMLGEEYLILCKHHPFVKHRPPLPPGLEDFVRDVTEALPVEELLMVSDVCISDYSSLIFEYSLFERPMIFFAPDLEAYCDWRGFFYSYEEMTPGPVVRTTQEAGALLRDTEGWFDKGQAAAFREKFMGACDGHASERIADRMEELSPA